MRCIIFPVLLLARIATAFRAPKVKPILSHQLLLEQKRTMLSAIGNTYLESLEQQTMQTAATTTENSQESKQGDDADEENLPEAKKLMKKIRQAGTAGIISFGMVQLGFWSLSLVVALGGYIKLTGHLPDWTDKDEMSKLGAEFFVIGTMDSE